MPGFSPGVGSKRRNVNPFWLATASGVLTENDRVLPSVTAAHTSHGLRHRLGRTALQLLLPAGGEPKQEHRPRRPRGHGRLASAPSVEGQEGKVRAPARTGALVPECSWKQLSGPWTAERSLLAQCKSAPRAAGTTPLPPNPASSREVSDFCPRETRFRSTALARGRSHVAEAAFSMIAATAAGCET
jgi:hypothetical protein